MTQRDRVLLMLKDAGDRGVHTFELRMSFIGNPSQRITELETLGYRITHTRERLHGKAVGTRYVLDPASGPEATSSGSPAPPPPTDSGDGPGLSSSTYDPAGGPETLFTVDAKPAPAVDAIRGEAA